MIYSTVVMTVVIVVFCEMLPKTAAINDPDRVALVVARPIDYLVQWFSPVLAAIYRLVRWMLALAEFNIGESDPILTGHEELRGAVDLLHREGSVEKQDRDMLGGLLDLRDLTVSDVMIHRTEMITVDAGESPEDVVKAILAAPVTRVPLWRDTPENIVGILHAERPAARNSGGRGRSFENRCGRHRATAVVRARHPPAVGATQGVSPTQDAVRARRGRIRRGDGLGHAGGYSRRNCRRHHGRA